MRARHKSAVAQLLLTAGLALPMASIGCGVHAYRVHDPYYNDDHRWNRGEAGYYQRWEVETHHDHVDFRTRNTDEQKQYWDWRHNQH